MKIGFLAQTLDRGTGGGKFAADLINGVRTLGHEVVILKELNDGSEGQVILGRGLKMITCIPEARKLLMDCDVIHALDGYPFGITAWFINKTLNKNLLISAQGTYAVAPLYRWSTSFLMKLAYLNANKVIAISEFTKSEILKKINLKNIIVIKHGIEKLINIQKKKSNFGQYILGVGGIKERKGYHISLEAFGMIKDKFPDLRYFIVADRDEAWQTILDKIIDSHDIKDRVIFMNNVSEVKLQELYDHASLFVLTPINTPDHHIEGFGLVYLEAARSGIPVIGTYGTGAEDAINNGKNGILVHQNNVTETADAMRQILLDKELASRMSKEGIEWAKLNTVEREVDQILEVYK